jgi:hypothetical protein
MIQSPIELNQSSKVYATLVCSVCGTELITSEYVSPALAEKKMWEMVREYGWTVYANKAYCRQCVNELMKTATDREEGV